MRLFISDIEIPLPPKIRIARTKQVNTIGRLDNRQTNFTQRIKIPKTKTVKLAFDNLGAPGSTSIKPYVTNEAYLYNDSGLAEIFNGYAVIDQTNDEYEVIIYDGYISFIKAIENKVLTDVGLEDLNHLKNLTNVLANWDDYTLPYRYIVADYNGKMVYDNGGTDTLNIDYLIPSVNVKWLWDKVFDYFGWTYSGSVFNTEAFNNTWLTYPKTIGDSSQVTTSVYTNSWTERVQFFSSGGISPVSIQSLFGGIGETVVNSNNIIGSTQNVDWPINTPNTLNNVYLTSTITQVVKVEVSGYFDTSSEIRVRLYESGTSGIYEQLYVEEVDAGENFSFVWYVTIPQGKRLSLTTTADTGSVNSEVSVIEGNQVDFEEAFIDFSVRDFINEVLWKFALTPFTDNKTGNIDFLTHREWLQTLDINDWSDKYPRKINEEYILSGYAQRNYIRHKYNDKEGNYNDGYLTISNINIKDTTDIISSLIYSPEREKGTILDDDYNIYQFWEKKNKDDGTVEYKELSNRFYFMRSETSNATINIGSEFQLEDDTRTSFPRESFTGLAFKDIVNEYYTPLYSILNSSKLLTVELYLDDATIHDLDFKKLIFIKQLGSYYILNKIPNYSGKGLYNCELLEVDYGSEQAVDFNPPLPSIALWAPAASPDCVVFSEWHILANYIWMNYTPSSATIYINQYDAHPDDGGVPSGVAFSDSVVVNDSQYDYELSDPLSTEEGWYEVYIVDNNGLTSNVEYVYVGGVDYDCSGGSSGTPSIEFDIEALGNAMYGVAHQRDVYYRFNNFTPSSATLKIRAWDYLGGVPTSGWTSVTLSSLTADTDHTYSNFMFPASFGFYQVRLETDTITFEEIRLVF